ncbi:MAG: GtrA family protein [Ruminococcus sp.]|nr:GtrA family protein [Ruminococcus sp.]
MNNKKPDTALREVRNLLAKKQFSAFFRGQTDNTYIQFFRYVFVGGLAAVLDWGLSSLIFFFVFGAETGAVCASLPWLTYSMIANGAGFIGGLVLNFVLSTCFVFQNSNVKNKLLEFLSFAAIGAVGLLITLLITRGFELLLADRTSMFQILGKAVSTAAAFLWNFFARKLLLYRS